MLHRNLFAACLLLCGLSPIASAQVFINEIHYDNAGADTGEAIEVAGPAGTDLTGWRIVLYNGSSSQLRPYGSTVNLTGTLVNQQGGYGTSFYPIPGIQNGAPDGIALIRPDDSVAEFLSYEGTFTATSGLASGLTSVDIGVAEFGSDPVGESLQLIGTGTQASDFTWAMSQPSTFCEVNTGQQFGDGIPGGEEACPDPGGDPDAITLVINEVDYDQPGSDTAEFIELKNVGTADVDLGGVVVDLINGSNNGSYRAITLPAETLGPDDYFVICGNPFNTPRCNLDASPDSNLVQNGSPDAVVIRLGSTIIDAVSYEGDVAGAVEGSGVGLADSSSTDFVSISRSPDGADTDLNNVDFSLRCATPGLENSVDASDCADPVPPIVINELHADPAGDVSGDANGDGIRDSGDDEFVEIVNISDGPLNVSGWTLADGFTVRHIFPENTIIESQCAVVVFGGGVPTGDFGNALVQTASDGSLGLNNGGDNITINNGTDDIVAIGYGSAGGDNQSLTLSPDVTGQAYVKHTTASGAGGRLYSPGTLVDGSQFSGCPVPPVGPFEIYEIQGAGNESPFAGQTVITQGNTVTAVGPQGFAMQTPDDRADMDAETSNGIYVFTGSAPAVAVGDIVDVTGDVVEFFGLTEFTNGPEVTVLSSGLAVSDSVTPVVFDATTPSPDPTLPSCTIGLECLEGMLVEVAEGAVTASNQRFGPDPVAEVLVTAAPERTFREPGIEFPGLPDLPIWDGNPEIFELDPDKLGLENLAIPAGSSFSATGIIGFEFGDYELWPSELAVTEAPLPRPVRHRRFLETTVGSLNLFRLFDDVDDPPGINALGETTDDTDQIVETAEYERRINKFVQYIVYDMRTPDVLAVQEVESLKVLEDLAAAINAAHPWARYEAYLIEGNDIGTIDVGFLVRKWRVWFPRIEQLGAAETYDPGDGSMDILHDRPPLVLRGWAGFIPINVMVVHNRSLGGIEGSEADRVREKRFQQAQSIAQKVQDIQSSRFGRNLVVIGDFNAFQFSDGYVDSIGLIRGDFDPDEALISGDDLVDPNLMNQLMSLPESERYSFVFRGNAQTLDHALTSQGLDYRVRGLEFARGNADAAVDLVNDDTTSLRASDHDGLVLYIYKGWLRKYRRR